MTIITENKHWTTKDLDGLPDIPGTHYEIIDGVLFVSHAPHSNHQAVCSQLYHLFKLWDAGRRLGFSREGSGVIFSDDNNVIPDFLWMSRERWAIAHQNGKFYAAPELAVEVLSSGSDNESRDREAKLGLYSRRGVSEYWIINWQTRELEIYRRPAENLPLQFVETLRDNDVITSPLFPSFNYTVNDVFEDLA